VALGVRMIKAILKLVMACMRAVPTAGGAGGGLPAARQGCPICASHGERGGPDDAAADFRASAWIAGEVIRSNLSAVHAGGVLRSAGIRGVFTAHVSKAQPRQHDMSNGVVVVASSLISAHMDVVVVVPSIREPVNTHGYRGTQTPRRGRRKI